MLRLRFAGTTKQVDMGSSILGYPKVPRQNCKCQHKYADSTGVIKLSILEVSNNTNVGNFEGFPL